MADKKDEKKDDKKPAKKEEEKDKSGMPKEQREMLQSCFNSFDSEKKGWINEDMMKSILEMMGLTFTTKEMNVLLKEVDDAETGKIDFTMFLTICGKFLVEESEDNEVIMKELKEIFNLYDRERNGFMTCDCLKGILLELDPTLDAKQLNDIVDEVDEDGSNSIEFEEFCKMMLGWLHFLEFLKMLIWWISRLQDDI